MPKYLVHHSDNYLEFVDINEDYSKYRMTTPEGVELATMTDTGNGLEVVVGRRKISLDYGEVSYIVQMVKYSKNIVGRNTSYLLHEETHNE